MIRHHLGKGITEQQRQLCAHLLLETADELKLPSDQEFRSALVGYLEWGSRLAVINSALPPGTSIEEAPMPAWNWGVPGAISARRRNTGHYTKLSTALLQCSAGFTYKSAQVFTIRKPTSPLQQILANNHAIVK